MTEAARPSSVLRALGPALASVLPARRAGLPAQAVVLAVTDAAARQLTPHGISIVAVTPDEGETFTAAKQAATRAVPTVAWVVVWLLLSRAVAKLPLPRPVRALMVAGVVYTLDVVSAGMGAQAVAARAAEPAEPAEPGPSADPLSGEHQAGEEPVPAG